MMVVERQHNAMSKKNGIENGAMIGRRFSFPAPVMPFWCEIL
jgi:hypothetical protein